MEKLKTPSKAHCPAREEGQWTPTPARNKPVSRRENDDEFYSPLASPKKGVEDTERRISEFRLDSTTPASSSNARVSPARGTCKRVSEPRESSPGNQENQNHLGPHDGGSNLKSEGFEFAAPPPAGQADVVPIYRNRVRSDDSATEPVGAAPPAIRSVPTTPRADHVLIGGGPQGPPQGSMRPSFGNGRNLSDGSTNSAQHTQHTQHAAAQRLPGSAGSKFLATFIICIPDDKDFFVAKRIIGPQGRNMRIISSVLQEGSKIRLRGKGSGYQPKNDVENNNEKDPLQINVSVPTPEAYITAKHLLHILLKRIYQDYFEFKKCEVRKPRVRFHEHPRNPPIDPGLEAFMKKTSLGFDFSLEFDEIFLAHEMIQNAKNKGGKQIPATQFFHSSPVGGHMSGGHSGHMGGSPPPGAVQHAGPGAAYGRHGMPPHHAAPLYPTYAHSFPVGYPVAFDWNHHSYQQWGHDAYSQWAWAAQQAAGAAAAASGHQVATSPPGFAPLAGEHDGPVSGSMGSTKADRN